MTEDTSTPTHVLQGTLVLPDRLVERGQVVIEGATIAEIANKPTYAATADYGDAVVAPGLIDLHVHGIAGVDVFDSNEAALQLMCDRFAAHGVTGWLSSTVTERVDVLAEAVAAARDFMAGEHTGARLLGTHLEGPFLDPEHKGMQNPAAIIPPDVEIARELVETGAGTVRRMSIAPERPGADDVIRYLIGQGIYASAAHTGATYEEAMRAVSLGVTQVTHCFNAMTGLHHRKPGMAGAAMLCDDLFAELIADGIHIHPAVMQLLIRVKGRERVMLVTDAMDATELPDGTYRLGDAEIYVRDGAARLADGTLASSTLTMENGVRNLVRMCGIPLVDAVYMASTTPAASMGWESRRGSLRPGFDADIAVWDPDFRVIETWINGNRFEPVPLTR